MIYLFTTSEKIGARLIRWGTGSKVSHMAIGQGLELQWFTPIVESRMATGVRKTDVASLRKDSKIIYALVEKGINIETSDSLFNRALSFLGKQYDWKGIAFYAVAIVVFIKILRIKLPHENKWGDKDDEFCSELLFANEKYLKSIGVDMDKYDKQMLDPKRAFEILWNSGKFELIRGEI